MSNTKVRSILADQCDISADSKGNCSLSHRGAAELLGVTKSNLSRQALKLSEIVPQHSGVDTTQSNAGSGLEAAPTFSPLVEGKISDLLFEKLLFWYAVEAPKSRTKEAKELLRLVTSIGVRGWMQAEAGHDGSVQELVQSVKIERSIREIGLEQTIEQQQGTIDRIHREALALRSNIDRGYVGTIQWELAKAQKQLERSLELANQRLDETGIGRGDRPQSMDFPSGAEIAAWVRLSPKQRRSGSPKSEPEQTIEERLKALEDAIQGPKLNFKQERTQRMANTNPYKTVSL